MTAYNLLVSVRFSLWKSLPFSLCLGELPFLRCGEDWQRMLTCEALLVTAQDQPKWDVNVQGAPGDHPFLVTVVVQRPWNLSSCHLPALIFFTSSPILGAVNLSLYLQPQQGAHFHRREDSFNKSSSFVQEQCSHWLEDWLELWLSLGRKLRKQIKGKWWAALSSWEAWGGGAGGGGDSPYILSPMLTQVSDILRWINSFRLTVHGKESWNLRAEVDVDRYFSPFIL